MGKGLGEESRDTDPFVGGGVGWCREPCGIPDLHDPGKVFLWDGSYVVGRSRGWFLLSPGLLPLVCPGVRSGNLPVRVVLSAQSVVHFILEVS